MFFCKINKVASISKNMSATKLSKVPSGSQLKGLQTLPNVLHLDTLKSDKIPAGFPPSNIKPALSLLESDSAFFVVQPYRQFRLIDTVMYTPAIFDTCHAKSLFILYQILHGIRYCHRQGVAVGDVNLQQILVDDKLWIELVQPSTKRIFEPLSEVSTGATAQVQPSRSCEVSVDRYGKYRIEDLPKLTQAWVSGAMNNFEYIMVLNYLAGRRMNDPNNHPVLPWVMDFSSPNGNYRDLTKSKFRLNKGDRQLDLTYESPADPYLKNLRDLEGDEDRAGHHITDVLSDITYYVYKARQTPKSVLCAYVRPTWVPHEYPSSIQRMQEWTPDECIPEFFTDTTIFTSIHEDLPDLEIPAWANGVEDFVQKHMATLEGAQVSRRLHHWIDITFGFKVCSF